jgi:pyruvate/2-oxoglutarate dehydrogenase complex dihydrolipoamide acyltransferase (E2) component
MGKRRWKDRKDGRYLYDTDPMHKIMPFLMPKRTECEVFLKETIDITEILKYLEEKKAVPGNRITMFSVLMSTVVRTMAMRPALNNFIVGHRLYRRNKIDIGFVVKKEFNDTGVETVARIEFEPSMTIFEITDKLYDHVDTVRSSGAGVDKIIKTLTSLPRSFTKIAIAFLRLLSYFGKVPKDIVDSDPNHTSAFVANMGSLQADAPFHHLNNWGTNSLFITIGTAEDRVLVIDNEITIRKCVDLAFTVDERIADGFYFARSVKVMKEILSDPSVLERPFEVNSDPNE